MDTWPVIHLVSPEQAYRNASLAAEAGVAGVFLIQMDGDDDAVLPAATFLRARLPALRLGANFLSLPPARAVQAAADLGLSAVWHDTPGVRSDGEAEDITRLSAAVHARRLPFFASVAFKYQPVDPEPGLAAVRAFRRGFIPTTSGVATGQAPDLGKLRAMRAALDQEVRGAPLALASGATPDNIAALAPFLSHVLVATGVSSTFHDFDGMLLKRFMENAAG